MNLPKIGDKFNAISRIYGNIAHGCPCICMDVDHWEVFAEEVKITKWIKLCMGKRYEHRAEHIERHFPFGDFSFKIINDRPAETDRPSEEDESLILP